MNEKILKLKGKTLAIIDWANVYGWFEKLKWEIDPKKLYNYLKSYPEIYDIRFYFGIEKNNKKSEEFHEEIKNIGYTLTSKEVKWTPVSLEKSHFKELVQQLFNVLDTTKITNTKISDGLYGLIQKIDKMVDDSIAMAPTGEAGYTMFDKNRLKEIYDYIGLLDSELKKLNISIENLQRNFLKPVLRRKCDFDVEITMDILNNINNFDGLILFSGDGDYKAIVECLLDNKKQVIVVHPFGLRGREYNELLSRDRNKPYLCAVEKLTSFLK